jgi:hypothetical protein
MATATLPRKPKPRRSVQLLERVRSRSRVDRANKVIRGVKILGRFSSNGRTYTEGALREAVPMYEGARVFVNHRRPRDQRDRQISEVFGVLRNVRYIKDALYGDLHYLENAPSAAQILEAAENAPNTLGLSHHAVGDVTEGPGGREIVDKITHVRSVDIVAEPATTNGLFESQTMNAKTVSASPADAFGNVIRTVAMNTKLSKAARLKKIGRLIDVSDQFAKNFSDDSAVQEDDDTDVEEDMPTRGEDGPLAESYRGSPARRSLLEHLGRAPASRSDSLLNFLGRGPQREAAANSLLASLGRR